MNSIFSLHCFPRFLIFPLQLYNSAVHGGAQCSDPSAGIRSLARNCQCIIAKARYSLARRSMELEGGTSVVPAEIPAESGSGEQQPPSTKQSTVKYFLGGASSPGCMSAIHTQAVYGESDHTVRRAQACRGKQMKVGLASLRRSDVNSSRVLYPPSVQAIAESPRRMQGDIP